MRGAVQGAKGFQALLSFPFDWSLLAQIFIAFSEIPSVGLWMPVALRPGRAWQLLYKHTITFLLANVAMSRQA